MKNTNTNAFKEKVFSYLLDCIDPEAYDVDAKTNAQKVAFFVGCIYKEYGHELVRVGNKQKWIASYFAGLPTACMIDYTYYNIIEVCKKWHEVEDFTPKQQDMLCDNWFNFMAFKMIQLCRAYKVEV